eukprot:2663207-Amphidinium_carterae.1
MLPMRWCGIPLGSFCLVVRFGHFCPFQRYSLCEVFSRASRKLATPAPLEKTNSHKADVANPIERFKSDANEHQMCLSRDSV